VKKLCASKFLPFFAPSKLVTPVRVIRLAFCGRNPAKYGVQVLWNFTSFWGSIFNLDLPSKPFIKKSIRWLPW